MLYGYVNFVLDQYNVNHSLSHHIGRLLHRFSDILCFSIFHHKVLSSSIRTIRFGRKVLSPPFLHLTMKTRTLFTPRIQLQLRLQKQEAKVVLDTLLSREFKSLIHLSHSFNDLNTHLSIQHTSIKKNRRVPKQNMQLNG